MSKSFIQIKVYRYIKYTYIAFSNILKSLIKHQGTPFLVLLLILVGGLGVRLYKIDNPIADWHSWRQSDTAAVSWLFARDGINILYPKYFDISSTQTGEFNPEGYRFVEFPVYNVLHASLSNAFTLPYVANSFEVWGRLISIICALITSFLLYLLGKRLMGTAGGLLSAFFYTFLPYNIYFTRIILPEPITVLFAVAALYFFMKFYDTGKNVWIYFSAVAFSFAMLLKPYMIFYALPIAVLTIKKYGFKALFKKYSLLIALDIALVPFFLWRIWENNYPMGIPFYKWAFNGDQIRFKPSFWRWIFGERIGNLILGTWGIVPFVLGIVRKSKESLFINTLLLGMFMYVSTVATANVRHDYYQTLIIPALSLALSNGSIFLWNNNNLYRSISRTILIFSLGIMFVVSATDVREFYKINHPEIIEAGKAVDSLVPKNALVIAPYNGDTAFLYQTKRKGWPYVDLPINELIDKGASYWVSVNFEDPQTQEVMKKYTVLKQTPSFVIVDLTKLQ